MNTYASVAFSLTVSTMPLASFSAPSLFASFDNSDFFSSNLSFAASRPTETNNNHEKSNTDHRIKSYHC